jgi:hypothetical protein
MATSPSRGSTANGETDFGVLRASGKLWHECATNHGGAKGILSAGWTMSISVSEILSRYYQDGSHVLFAALAAISAWCSTHAQLAQFERDVERDVIAAGGSMLYGQFDWDSPNAVKLPQSPGSIRGFTKWIFGERQICQVSMRRAVISPELAERIARLPYLESFRAEISGMDSARIRPFLKATNLRALQLSENKELTDEALAGLSQLHHLRILDLSYNQITDKTWDEIIQLRELETLNIGRTRIEAKKLPKAKGFPNLQEVWAERCPLSDEFGILVGASPKLRLIFLKNANTLTDDAVSKFAGHSSLETVTLSNTRITDKSMEILATLPKLKRLHRGNTIVTKTAIERFRILRNDVEVR